MLGSVIDLNNSIGTGGVTLIVLSLIQAGISISTRRSAKQVQSRVGNGWTERLGETLGAIKESADRAELQATEAKKVAAGANESARKTRGIVEETLKRQIDHNSKVDQLIGKFDQHIQQHQWTGSNRRHNGGTTSGDESN